VCFFVPTDTFTSKKLLQFSIFMVNSGSKLYLVNRYFEGSKEEKCMFFETI